MPPTVGFRPYRTQVLGNYWPEFKNPPTDRFITGGVAVGIGAAGIGAAGGAGERIRLNVPIIDAHDQRPSAKYAGGRTVHLSGFGCSRVPKSQPGSQAIRVVRLP